MLKKLGGFLIIVLLGLIIWAVCNMEGLSRKYVYPIGYSDMVETASMETGDRKSVV